MHHSWGMPRSTLEIWVVFIQGNLPHSPESERKSRQIQAERSWAPHQFSSGKRQRDLSLCGGVTGRTGSREAACRPRHDPHCEGWEREKCWELWSRWGLRLERHYVGLLFFFFLIYIEKMKTVVSSIYLWVVFTVLLLCSLVVVTLIVKKVTH